MLDLLITHATLPDGRQNMSIAVQDGRIAEVTEGLQAPAHETVDAGGMLRQPTVCGRTFPHGFDPELRPAARERKRHAA